MFLYAALSPRWWVPRQRQLLLPWASLPSGESKGKMLGSYGGNASSEGYMIDFAYANAVQCTKGLAAAA